MDINQKFWSFSGEVFDEIYLQQLRIEGVVHVTATISILTESKLSVISKKSTTILKIHNYSLVNLILLFKGKGRRSPHIFGFYYNITHRT